MKQRKHLRRAKVRAQPSGPWGGAVQRLRHAHGWTRAQTAAAAGITATTYGLVERGHHTRTSVLARLAVAFGVPITRVLMTTPIDPQAIVAQPDVEAHVLALLTAVRRAKVRVFSTGEPLSPDARAVVGRGARARPAAAQRRA